MYFRNNIFINNYGDLFQRNKDVKRVKNLKEAIKYLKDEKKINNVYYANLKFRYNVSKTDNGFFVKKINKITKKVVEETNYDLFANKHGKSITYYSNNKIHTEHKYRHGKLLINSKIYNPNGTIQQETILEPTKKITKEYNKNGVLIFKIEKDILNDKNKYYYMAEYYKNGNKKFEGEYLNDKKNGKGTEYDEYKNIKFIGNFLNNQKNGKGTEYYKNGNKKFEGEYLNNQKNGKGTEYYEDGYIKFEGEYLNDKKNGKGTEYDEYKNIKFIGNFLNNQKNGKGTEYYEDGYIKFMGNYLSNKRNGKGTEYYEEHTCIKFIGNYIDGQRCGEGTEYDTNENIKFIGKYLNNERCGIGIEYDKNGKSFMSCYNKGEQLNINNNVILNLLSNNKNKDKNINTK